MKSSKVETVAVAVASIFAAHTDLAKAEGAELKAFARVVKAAPLNDADWMAEFRGALIAKFGADGKDAAQYRLNIINNARKVAYGGTKDGKPIKGKGHAYMVQILDGADSMRELKPAMAEAVPAGLKGESGGKRKGSGKKAQKGNTISVPKVATREEAFAAARKVLELVSKFLKPSDTKLTESIAQCSELLK